MNSIQFPNIFNRNSVNLVEDYEATKQNIKLLLYSEKGELFGDPYYGMGFKRHLFSQDDYVLQDLLLDEIYTALKVFMPQLIVSRNEIKLQYATRPTEIYDSNGQYTGITIDKGDVYVQIRAINKADYQTNIYNIALMANEA